jgi:two-component system OmpR family response regulator
MKACWDDREMNGQAHVLVVDDQPNIVDMLSTVLRFHGFAVSTAATAAEALAVAAGVRPDLVVLDVRLPDGDGLEVCRALKATGLEAGIVFLTARDAPRDKVMGLTMGGDDYVTKPFSVDELVARVRAVLRRLRPVENAAGVLRFGDLELDEDACQARRAGQLLALSPTEFKLLRYLMRNPGRVLTRPQILDAVWSYDFGGGSNVVDTYIGYLRRKLAPHGPPVIVTARGFGYVLRAGG